MILNTVNNLNTEYLHIMLNYILKETLKNPTALVLTFNIGGLEGDDRVANLDV